MQKDLTSGNILKTITYFSLPYLLSYFLQTLYGMADLFIMGQFNSVDATTAVSIGSQVMHMITVIIVGLTEKRFKTAEKHNSAHIENRFSRCRAGRIYSDCVYHRNNFCE